MHSEAYSNEEQGEEDYGESTQNSVDVSDMNII